jgi:ribosomal protein S18 acetylase RimI-like enzyme
VTTNLDLRISSAAPDDFDALRRLFRRSSLSNDGDRAKLLANPDALELSDRSVREGRARVAVTADGNIVGFVTSLVAGDGLELEDLFVDPDWMKRGVGRALVLDVVETARRRGYSQLEVIANPHALGFYEKVGFVVDREVETRFGPASRMCLAISPQRRVR